MKIEKHSRVRLSVIANGESTAFIYFGENEACKTEAEATEAAELLKTFFEAKEAGKVAQLIVNDDCHRTFDFAQRPKNTVIDQMNESLADSDAADHQPCLNCKNPIYCQWGKKCSPDNVADLIAGRIWGNRAHDMTVDQYEAFTIAHNAALIFAHNTHNFDERRAVQSAAKILNHAKQTV